MTERERFRTRGMFYYITNDYEACVKEYGDLLARYEADAAARNNLALCSTKLRDMTRAREEMQRVVEILPKRSLYRVNAALYSAYASDFGVAEEQARVAQELQRSVGAAGAGAGPAGPGQDSPRRIKSYEALASVPGAGRTYTVVGPGRRGALRGPLRRRRVALHRRRQGRPGREGRRPRRRQVRGAGLHRAGPRPPRRRPAPPPIRRWPTAPAMQIRFLAGADLRPGRRGGPGQGDRRRGWAPSCRPSRRPTARSSTA